MRCEKQEERIILVRTSTYRDFGARRLLYDNFSKKWTSAGNMYGQFVDKQSKIQMDLVVLREQKSPTWSWDSLETSVAMRTEHKDLILWTSTCRPFSTSNQRSTLSWIFQNRRAVFDPESNQEPAGVEYSIARTSTYRRFSTSSQRSTTNLVFMSTWVSTVCS